MLSLSIIVLAGGQSTRMGQEKALLPFHGQPLIERVVQRVKTVADELVINTNQPELFGFLGIPLVPDQIGGKGPLGGLFTALTVAHSDLVAVIACDMPFVSPALICAERDWLIAGGWDVVIPHSNEGLEPLHAVYRKAACLPAIQRVLAENRLRMVSWLEYVRVREVHLDEVAAIDPAGTAFTNVNTLDEFKQAEQLESMQK